MPTQEDSDIDVLSEILAWSEDRPDWQREALRRLVTGGSLSESDMEELAILCKAECGLAEADAIEWEPLGEEHLPQRAPGSDPVTIESLKHHHGVNALASNQLLEFGPGMTIVFGPNAAGKSGYTRILKRVCRARGAEKILTNVFEERPPSRPSATVVYKVGEEQCSHHWRDQDEPPEELGQASVFDTHCASVYVREETDVAFRPFGLDLFDSLCDACETVKKALDKERLELQKRDPDLPEVAEGTAVHKKLSNITSMTEESEIKALGTLSEDERETLDLARKKLNDLKNKNPSEAAKELNLRAARLEALAAHLERVEKVTGDKGLQKVRKTQKELRKARTTAEELRSKTFPNSLLTGTGGKAWRKLWDAADEFSSREAYPGQSFPVTEDARCVLCQQDLEDEAIERMRQFHAYLESSAQQEAEASQRELSAIIDRLDALTIKREETANQVEELRLENESLAETVEELLNAADKRREEVLEAVQKKTEIPTELPSVSTASGEVRKEAARSRERAQNLLSEATPEKRRKLEDERDQLEARETLGKNVDVVIAEIQRQKRLAAYNLAIRDTHTRAITDKSTEVTRKVVTERLAKGFTDELQRIGFTQLEVALKATRGKRGALYHKLILERAPERELVKIASEGESRALAIAAFFAELSTATGRSAILFDDPVSSLDHNWRENVARRLAKEARDRQVIVFTHDVVFALALDRMAKRAGAECARQQLRHDLRGAGVVEDRLPWIAMNVKKRIGVLKDKWQAADKLSRNGETARYEHEAKEIYGFLREAWERAVEEVLLNGVVQRYGQEVQTKRVSYLVDINDEDYAALEAGMEKCSRWLRGHDQPAAEHSPVPPSSELKQDIENLESWVKTIRKRRN